MLKSADLTYILKHFLISSLFILISIIVMVLAYRNSLNYAQEPAHIWFQRSGSIITLLNALSEFILNRIYYNTQMPGVQNHKWVQKTYLIIRNTSFSLILAGTIIWGYGDLIYNYLIK